MSSTSSNLGGVAEPAACPTARDATTEALWTKLEEVQRLLAHQPDAKELFTKYTVLRSVVGEVGPVFADAVRVRVKVFCEEQAFAVEEECDDLEAVSMHVVAYFNYTQFTEEMKELAVQARLLKSIGMEGSGLRFQRRQKNVDVSGEKSVVHGVASTTGPAAAQLRESKYRPALLIPVGTLRLRRVSKASRAGKLTEVVAKIERVCVVVSVRRFDVGRMLMNWAEYIARDAFHVRWSLIYAQQGSRNFYSKVGYVPKDGKVFMELHMPHVVMVKCLADASV